MTIARELELKVSVSSTGSLWSTRGVAFPPLSAASIPEHHPRDFRTLAKLLKVKLRRGRSGSL